MHLTRFNGNPILTPESENEWESFATFNGNVFSWKGAFCMVYRALSGMRHLEGKDLRMSSIGLATSNDGKTFHRKGLLLRPEISWDRFSCEDPRATVIDNKLFVFYTAIGAYPFEPSHIRAGVAIYSDLDERPKRHLLTPFNAKAMVMFPEKISGNYAVLVTANTDMPPSTVGLASFENLNDLWSREFWGDWYRDLPSHAIHLARLDTDQIEVGSAPIKTEEGWLLIYCRIQNYGHPGTVFGIEATLLDLNDPRRILARSREPLLTPEAGYEVHGTVPNVIFPSGSIVSGDELRVYYGGADTVCALATCHLDLLVKSLNRERAIFPSLKRSSSNPILTSRWDRPWERLGVYNPGVLQDGDNMYVVYRAQDQHGTSTMGLATFSGKGPTLLSRDNDPIYVPRMDFELKSSHTGVSGCEDPRLTQISDQIYMLYTAYRGDSPPRVALTSISIGDFRKKNWKSWTDPILISPPGVADKDACLFPEQIKGNFVTIHRIEPDIVFDFRPSLSFNGKSRWLESQAFIQPRKGSWEGVKIGANTPPFKTPDGWLFLYHGVGSHDHHYRLGAMLLDLENPATVLGRTYDPILQPQEQYEQRGQVRNVVFPCGLSVFGDEIFVFYGGGDSVTCLATVSMSQLLSYLKECGDIR